MLIRSTAFDSVDQRWEPGAGDPLAGFCPGGGPKGPSLPGLVVVAIVEPGRGRRRPQQ